MASQTIQLPLLHDHHTHPLLYASLGAAVDLESTLEKQVALDRLRQDAKRRNAQRQGRSSSAAEASTLGEAPADLQLALGWRSNAYSLTAKDLDDFGPLAIFNLSLHQLLVNEPGRECLRERYGDDVDRIEDRHWYEANFRRVLNWFANLHATVDHLQQFYDRLESLGIYSAEELLLVDEREIQLFSEAGLLSRTRFWADPATFDQLSDDAREQVAGFKLFTDGALGARTAALKQGYLVNGAPDPNQCGMLVYSPPEFQAIVESCLTRRRALAIHAIGDLAIEQVVETLEIANCRYPTDQVRIEHAQLIDRGLAGRCKALGVTLSMQPNFSNDSIHYADRISAFYCQMNNPFRMLIDEIGFVPGDDLIFGSDGMPHGAANALEQSLVSALPQQRVTLDEFIAAYGGDSTHGWFELPAFSTASS